MEQSVQPLGVLIMNAGGAAGRDVASHNREKNVSATGVSLPEDGELAAQVMNRESGEAGPSVVQMRSAAPAATVSQRCLEQRMSFSGGYG